MVSDTIETVSVIELAATASDLVGAESHPAYTLRVMWVIV
jgi:hypothetical protein